MKIALMLSGETRSFFEPPSLLDGLRQEGYTVDVFAHLPVSDPGVGPFIEFWKKPPDGFCLRSLQLGAVRDIPETGIAEHPDCAKRPWYKTAVPPITSLQAVLRHTAASAAVGSLVRQAELQDGGRYDWVIKTRYDLKFVRPMEQLADLKADNIYCASHDNWDGYNDKFSFGSSEVMELHTRLFYAIPDLCRSGLLFHPEKLLGAHLKAHDVVPSRTRSISRVVRYGVRDEINWIPYRGDIADDAYLPVTKEGHVTQPSSDVDKVTLDSDDIVTVKLNYWRAVPQQPVIGIQHFYETIEGQFDFQATYSEAVSWADDGAIFVEVGSWMGKSTAYMAVEIANSGKKVKFYAVDTWLSTHADTVGHGISIKRNFLRNIAPVKDHVEPMEMTSREASTRFVDKSVDFVFLDADSSYEGLSADIMAWLPKMKPGGVLAGHDYAEHPGCGVIQAVKELLPGYMLRHPGGPTPVTTTWEYTVPS